MPNQRHVVWCSLWTKNAIKVIIGAQRIYLIKKKTIRTHDFKLNVWNNKNQRDMRNRP